MQGLAIAEGGTLLRWFLRPGLAGCSHGLCRSVGLCVRFGVVCRQPGEPGEALCHFRGAAGTEDDLQFVAALVRAEHAFDLLQFFDAFGRLLDEMQA